MDGEPIQASWAPATANIPEALRAMKEKMLRETGLKPRHLYCTAEQAIEIHRSGAASLNGLTLLMSMHDWQKWRAYLASQGEADEPIVQERTDHES